MVNVYLEQVYLDGMKGLKKGSESENAKIVCEKQRWLHFVILKVSSIMNLNWKNRL
jgi:hypothetical protein